MIILYGEDLTACRVWQAEQIGPNNWRVVERQTLMMRADTSHVITYLADAIAGKWMSGETGVKVDRVTGNRHSEVIDYRFDGLSNTWGNDLASSIHGNAPLRYYRTYAEWARGFFGNDE